MSEPIFDHEKLEVYRLSIEYVAASYETAKGLAGANRHIRDQWLRAAIHDVLTAVAAVEEEPNRQGKSQPRRMVSMLTRLIQRTNRAAQDPSEYEYRDAEYEYETEDEPEPTRAPEPGLREDPRTNEALEVEGGKVRYHSKDRDEVYRKAVHLRPKRFAVVYTSRMSKDAAVVL